MAPDTSQLVFGPGALVVVSLYLLSMLGIGWLGRRRRREDSLADFYLAGRSVGLAVLFLTLYATQYSGNTMLGYAGKTYRIGFEWTVSVLFMFSIIPGYLLFAPRLVRVARARGFITPSDYITHRFASPALSLLGTAIMIYALSNYTLAQLKAMGAAVEGLTDGAVPSAYGIIALAIIMVVYETLGGMRSVAWTDVIQGVVLLVGFGILLVLIPRLGGGLEAVDDSNKSAGPADPEVRADAVEVMSIIRASAVGVDFDSLLTNPQTIPGERGELVITLTKWTFDGYSPDGNLQLDGDLNLGILSDPITMRGLLTISGSKDADVDVDMTIAFVPDPENPGDLDLELGGDVTYNGVRFAVSDLLEASEPDGGAADGE